MPYLSGALSEVSIIVCTVVETVITISLFIWRMLKLSQNNNDSDSQKSKTIIQSESTTESYFTESGMDNEGTGVAKCSFYNNFQVHAYDNVTSVLLVFFFILSVVFAIGMKKKSRHLMKSYLDMNIILSILCLIVFILTLSEGNIEKNFAALMGFFLLLRVVGIFLGFTYYWDRHDGANIINASVKYRASSVPEQGNGSSTSSILSL